MIVFLIFHLLIISIKFELIQSKNIHEVENNANTELKQFSHSIAHIFSLSQEQLIQISSNVDRIQNYLNQSDSKCYETISQVFRDGFSNEWTAELINSNSFATNNFVSNFLLGKISLLGDFDRCVSLHDLSLNQNRTDSENKFNGKYCLASVKTPQLDYNRTIPNKFVNVSDYFERTAKKWLTYRNRIFPMYGICVPSICQQKELSTLFHKYFNKSVDGFIIDVDYCQESTNISEYPLGYLISAFIIFLVLGFSLIATFVNIFFKSFPYNNYLQCFDLISNWHSLIETTKSDNNSEHDLRFLSGISTVLIALTIFVHSILFYNIITLTNASIMFSNYPTFYDVTFRQQLGPLDTALQKMFIMIGWFFVLSGFITTYNHLKMKTSQSFSVYFLLRYVRLVPSIIGIICMTIVFQKLGSGPLFHERLTDVHVKSCYTHWWTNILLITNFFNYDQMCGTNLWFAAANFQLCLLRFPIRRLYLQSRAISFSIALMLASLVIAFPVYWYFDIGGIFRFDFPVLFNSPIPKGSIRNFYTSPIVYVFPYFSGVISAIYLLKSKSKNINSLFFNDFILVLLFLATFLSLAVSYPEKFKTNEGAETKLSYSICAMINFIFTTFTLNYAVVLLTQAKKSIIKTILSAKIFQILGKLSYGLYLVNPLVIWFNLHQIRQTQVLTHFYLIQMSILIYVESIFMATILTLFFEFPFRDLTSILKKKFIANPIQNNNLEMK